ncbi:MAG: arylsulfatase [Opitutaceae bacterium]|nr:arylsulfatase [Opitutaceae bacterium]
MRRLLFPFLCALASLRAASPPNVLVVLWDDIGFAQFGCYGGPLATPTVDRLAAQGVRYSNFHVAPVCSPTRAALLTGRNPHAVGMAAITEFANGERNSRGGLDPAVPTLADQLRAGGYGTYAVGKWHLTPMTELNTGASSRHWPTGRGFDHFFGFMSGETNPWAPELFADRTRLEVPPAGHGEAALVDRAIRFLAEHRATAPAKPFFLYFAPMAGHAPHHVAAERLARWRGKFDAGWDAARDETLARQKKLGLIAPHVALPPRNPGIKAWADLPAAERRLYARYYETFAAFVEFADEQLGRLIAFLERSGQLDNTLVIVASDNGASPEGGPEGMWNEVRLFTTNSFDRAADGLPRLDTLGGPLSYPTYPTGWTMAGNTPFRLTKGAAHEGGTRVPLIVRWPARIRDAGAIRHQFHHVVDLMPTVLEAAGAPAPAGLAGTSLAYSWADAAAPSRRETQYTEIYGHRSIYHRGWKAVVFHPPGKPFAEDRWELYDFAHDPNELHDLAAREPAKLAELIAVWDREAAAHDVLPLDDRRAARELLLPPDAPGRAARIVFDEPVSGLHKGVAPDLRGRAWTLTADLTTTEAWASGAIAAFGGRFAGWSLYLRDGAPCFAYNYAGLERTALAAPAPLRSGPHRVEVRFNPAADGAAEAILSVNGREAARARVPRTLTLITHETFDLGCDLFTPVTEDYTSPARLAGAALGRVVIESRDAGR